MPYVSVYVDSDDVLEESDDEDLKSELVKRGYHVSEKGRPIAAVDGLERIEHLSLCGLTQEAQAEALRLVGDALWRTLN